MFAFPLFSRASVSERSSVIDAACLLVSSAILTSCLFSLKLSLWPFFLSAFVFFIFISIVARSSHLVFCCLRFENPAVLSSAPSPHIVSLSLSGSCLVFQRLSFLIGVPVHQLSSSACFLSFLNPPNSHLPLSSHLLCIPGIRQPASCPHTSRFPCLFLSDWFSGRF